MAHLDLQTGSYDAAATLLGSRDSRRIGHNTTLRRVNDGRGRDSDTLAVRYHATDIITLTADGWLELNTGGWHTVTTWQRINALLPGRWGVGSYGKRGAYLWHGGHPITPYVDGLSVNDALGAVGMDSDVLLTADDVAAIEATAEAADALRAERRTARLLREHPTVRPVTYREDVPHTDYSSPLPSMHRGWRASLECDRCRAEESAWRAIRRDTLAADHANGHAWRTADGTMSGPAGPCPWECPNR